MGRRARMVCFVIVTLWKIPVILTANYMSLNYLVLPLGFLLLDDRCTQAVRAAAVEAASISPRKAQPRQRRRQRALLWSAGSDETGGNAVMLTWTAASRTTQMLRLAWRDLPLPKAPIAWPSRSESPTNMDYLRLRCAAATRSSPGIERWRAWQPDLFGHKPQLVNEARGSMHRIKRGLT